MSDTQIDTHIETDGIVKESCRGIITVELATGQIVKATLSGKMKMNKINVLPQDKVLLKMSIYDTSKGIIFKLIREKRREESSGDFNKDRRPNGKSNQRK
jgi:translation initiation factor IF-1